MISWLVGQTTIPRHGPLYAIGLAAVLGAVLAALGAVAYGPDRVLHDLD